MVEQLQTLRVFDIFLGGPMAAIQPILANGWSSAEQTDNAKVPLGYLDLVGLTVCLTGFFLEGVADIPTAPLRVKQQGLPICLPQKRI